MDLSVEEITQLYIKRNTLSADYFKKSKHTPIATHHRRALSSILRTHTKASWAEISKVVGSKQTFIHHHYILDEK